ncbi:MAG: hypothetical protein WED10_13300 [Brumimicrobium sp.]
MSTAEIILKSAKNFQRTKKAGSESSTNSRFYVRRWSASKSEMEEVRQFIREKRRPDYFREKNISDKKFQEIKSRIVKK